MVSFEVEDGLLKAIDAHIKSRGFYSSRSEFFKDSVRRNLEEREKWLRDFRASALELRKIAISRGMPTTPVTQEERDAFAKEYMKKNKIKIV